MGQVGLTAPGYAFGELLDLAPFGFKSSPRLMLLVGPFLRQGSFTSVPLRGPCVQPAPKSRFRRLEYLCMKIKSTAQQQHSRASSLLQGGCSIDKSVSAKTALFPAEAGSTGCAVSGMIVPTLRVGMHPVTLCVTLRGLNARCLQDAERPELRHHAERGNEQKQGRRPRSETAAATSTVGPASAGKLLICSRC